ncbi:MAG TPA: vitamin K epoxide reductase family protein [Deinococcales bacterium]|nr:vitamin K epoxide reductase family protein [Deinococcales bacterium]
MLVAGFALIGGLVALYLLLTHLGLSTLVCPIGGCEVVQASQYSYILGIPVAALGLAYFLVILALATIGLFRQAMLTTAVQPLLVVLTGIGILPYLPLTYIELFVLHSVCMWCVISSIAMIAAFLSATWGTRRTV